ncbi:MAG: hypothetical protein GW893_11055 [Armatimonadetes bacterium]|nr:hypothetical protein [Armatimonadota bacterium]PIU64833.1 MAG: hypothetical protein COS85_11010 [Armatimonadetes bacterium CG07_land_8_20_14_0_80_59_28]PJB69049.1 MAG: hypothetical protein CO095_10460 [Armatimonadetes bacterium CG_4_9_14_3_um_filter_58_7]
MSVTTVQLDPIAVTSGAGYHFFGYYDKQQWDVSGRYLLGLETTFQDRSPLSTDEAVIGVIDLEGDRSFRPVATTRSWCWQQGCMLQWLPGSQSQIIYNDRIADRFVAIILNVHTGEQKTLPRPIYTISPDGKWALSLNFSRLAIKRPGYGYNGLRDHWDDVRAAADDGIYLMELATGNHHLVVDVASLSAASPTEEMRSANHWVNHLLFNHTGERFIFLHRWSHPMHGFQTRFYTVNRDGTDRFLAPVDNASHFIWYDAKRFLVWATTEKGSYYYLCTDETGGVEAFAPGVLTDNGHCTVSPDGQWILTDEYPDAQNTRPLILYRIADGQRFDVGRFYSPPELTGEMRCDLHPRWSRDGRCACFDSAHTGRRQMYVIDVSPVVSQSAS